MDLIDNSNIFNAETIKSKIRQIRIVDYKQGFQMTTIQIFPVTRPMVLRNGTHGSYFDSFKLFKQLHFSFTVSEIEHALWAEKVNEYGNTIYSFVRFDIPDNLRFEDSESMSCYRGLVMRPVNQKDLIDGRKMIPFIEKQLQRRKK